MADPGGGGPWGWRTLGMADPGDGGPEPLFRAVDESDSCRLLIAHPNSISYRIV